MSMPAGRPACRMVLGNHPTAALPSKSDIRRSRPEKFEIRISKFEMELPPLQPTSVFDGATVMFGGFGIAGVPGQLIEALRQQGARNLTVISNGAGRGEFALGGLLSDGRVRARRARC